MKVEILNIGDELLIGQVLNTNAQWLAEQLTGNGFQVTRMVTVADQMQEILDAFKEGLECADIVLVTGGLGPTNDDLTREALCRFFNCGMKTDEPSRERIIAMFGLRGLNLSPLNRMQADVPERSEAIPNYDGTSPGMWFDVDGKVLAAMPGVPFELKSMMKNVVIPRLIERFHPGAVVSKTVLVQGVGESYLAVKIKEWEDQLPEGCSLAYLPQPGIVRLRLLMRGADAAVLENTIAQEVKKLQELLPEEIFGFGDDTLAGVVGNLLKASGETLSTAESCTGGNIAQMITSVPGSSAYFQGSVVSYSNEVKIHQLGVPADLIAAHGAVSEEVVTAMANNVRNLMKTTWSIAVSGIAGPDGGSPEKPVGTTWIAVAGPGGTVARKFLLGDHRGRNITRASLSAINLLRLQMLGRPSGV